MNITTHSVSGTGEIVKYELVIKNLLQVEITIGNAKFRASERDGALRISVDNSLVIRPVASNTLMIVEVP